MANLLVLAILLSEAGGHVEAPPHDAHAGDDMSCPAHVHNLVGLRAIGVAAYEHGAGHDAIPEYGFGLAYERTLIETWLELEVSTNALFSEEGTVVPIDVVFKKPFHLSHRFDPFIGLGGIVAFGVSGEERFVAPGAIASVGTYVWAGERWGASAEFDFAIVREPAAWVSELEVAAGPVVRF